jgi:hypothetical protein
MASPLISWLNDPTATADSSLILDPPILSGNASDPLVSRIVYTELYLNNLGDADADNAGFFISPALPSGGGAGGDMVTFEEVIKWSSLLDPSSIPYGVYTVFGFDDAAGTNSYIDKFIADTLTPAEAAMFSHTWEQGVSPLNALALDSAYRYVGGSYIQNKDFELHVSGDPALGSGETTGILKVLFGVRIPDSIDPIEVPVSHDLYYEVSS